MTRLNSKLEAEGAEFLVLGNLLIEGIDAHKTYTNMPGYDLIATNPYGKNLATIQVKSRWATDYDGGFLIKNIACDFVVFVALNRGYRYAKKKKDSIQDAGKDDPDFYVFPSKIIEEAPRTEKWGKLFIRNIPDYRTYIDGWHLIRDHLKNKI